MKYLVIQQLTVFNITPQLYILVHTMIILFIWGVYKIRKRINGMPEKQNKQLSSLALQEAILK